MGEDGNAARRPDPGDGLSRLRQLPRHIGRGSFGQITVEGFLRGLDVAFVHQHAGDMGPADRLGAGQSLDLLIGQVQPQMVQLFDDARIAPVTARPELCQSAAQRHVFPIQEVAEEVQFVLAVTGTDLDAGDHFNAQACAGLDGLRNAGHDVVIGDGEGADSGLLG